MDRRVTMAKEQLSCSTLLDWALGMSFALLIPKYSFQWAGPTFLVPRMRAEGIILWSMHDERVASLTNKAHILAPSSYIDVRHQRRGSVYADGRIQLA